MYACGGAAAKARRAMVQKLEVPVADEVRIAAQSALRYRLHYLLEDNGSESVPAWSTGYVAQTIAHIARLLPPAA